MDALGLTPNSPFKNSGKVGKGTKGSGFREPLGSLSILDIFILNSLLLLLLYSAFLCSRG